MRTTLISGPGPRWGSLLVFFAVLALALFYHYRIDSVPGEMFSDQAEKLLDVQDVLNGQTSIFFPRNTGREPFQFYLTAGNPTVGDGHLFHQFENRYGFGRAADAALSTCLGAKLAANGWGCLRWCWRQWPIGRM